MASAVPSAAPGVPASSPATAASPRDAAPGVALTSSAPPAPAKGLTLREVNAARITIITSRIASFVQGGCPGDPSHLVSLCWSLARYELQEQYSFKIFDIRGIDFSVSAGDVYANAHELPLLVKQVYKLKNEPSLQVAIMMLLISVKNACRNGWFDVVERNELITMANEMTGVFSFGSFTPEESQVLSVISMIMTRFYPQLKFESLLVSLEAKSGYDILVTDFFIPRDKPPNEKILLFVAQKDNIETSSCLISLPHVNFLVNGRGVERRTTAYVDVGPQFPTDITHMLKYGTNILQAVGYFGGNYVIAVAFMSKAVSSSIPMLQDYVQPVAATVAQDAEIIEGPSKISLNCPISFRRIKTPVKGHNCKHRQCFDYENFMAMNARKPSWRCPHCNQSVSCVDIRIDQSMVKILADTGENGTHVVISADGSWKIVEDHGAVADKPHEMLTGGGDGMIDCEPNGLLNSSSDVVDLTMEEDISADVGLNLREIEALNSLLNQNGTSNAYGTEERKPVPDSFQGFSVSEFTSEAIQVPPGQVMDELWSGISLATATSVVTGNVSQPNFHMLGAGLHVQNPSLDPVITDAVSPALNREDADNFLLPTSATQSSMQAQQLMATWHLQQTHFGNSIVTNESQRQPILRHVTRTPIAIQALPAHPQIPSLRQRPPTAALSLTSVPSVSVQASPSVLVKQAEVNTGTGRQQFGRMPNSALSSTQIQSTFQNRDVQSSQYHLNPVSQHIMGIPAQNPPSVRPLTNQPRVGSFGAQPSPGGQTILPQHRNAWTSSQPSRFSTLLQHATQGTGNIGGLVNRSPVMPAQQSVQAARLQAMQASASRGVPYQATADNCRLPGGEQVRGVREGTPEALITSGSGDAPAEQSWRPTGRMRGSLTGNAYAVALSHYMLQSSQQPAAVPASADQSGASASEHCSLLPDGTNDN